MVANTLIEADGSTVQCTCVLTEESPRDVINVLLHPIMLG